jgi:2'-5' RNA ligase superfamily
VGTSAIVVVVPEAEPLVATHRLRHDPAAALGVPAHVTILYPFCAVVDESTMTRVAEICQSFGSFPATFATVGRFPGEVVWLRPDPSDPFSALIAAFVEAFPDCPPYGGTVPDPIPHLTVGDGVDRSIADSLERKLIARLPVSTVVERLTLLIEDDDGRWSAARTWPLQRRNVGEA